MLVWLYLPLGIGRESLVRPEVRHAQNIAQVAELTIRPDGQHKQLPVRGFKHRAVGADGRVVRAHALGYGSGHQVAGGLVGERGDTGLDERDRHRLAGAWVAKRFRRSVVTIRQEEQRRSKAANELSGNS